MIATVVSKKDLKRIIQIMDKNFKLGKNAHRDSFEIFTITHPPGRYLYLRYRKY